MKKILATCLLATLLISCASQPTDSAANSTTMGEIAKFESDLRDGADRHWDVLAYGPFQKSREALKEAKQAVMDKSDNADALKALAEGRSQLERARDESLGRAAPVRSVLDARHAAIRAGADSSSATQAKLSDLDEQLRTDVENAKDWKAAKISALQNKYLDLELAAITNTQLSKAYTDIENARAEGAKSLTPKTLKTAEVDFNTAKNIIASNRNEPSRYSAAVAKAIRSADFLRAVLTSAKSGSTELDEATAVGIVNRDQKISQLKAQMGSDKREGERNVSDLQSKLGAEKDESAKMSDAYAAQGRRLQVADGLVDLQNAIDTARKSFSTAEADVFQQGNSLLIRLKSIRFANGRSELPSDSLPLLSKVKEVAIGLGPKAMVVEGHTDSTGDAASNLRLSQERAKAVSEYFGANGISADRIETKGFGFEKPIAANKTKQGRSQNRRVDVIISPSVRDASSTK